MLCLNKTHIYKTKNEICLFFHNLCGEFLNVNLIDKIISLFDAEFIFGECFLENEEILEENYFKSKEEIKIFYIENEHGNKQLIIGVPKKYSKEFFGISKIFNTTLTGNLGKKDDWGFFLSNQKLIKSDVSFDVNDNDGSYIRFDRKKDDYKIILAKIESILEKSHDDDL